jgi:hypothetical protein
MPPATIEAFRDHGVVRSTSVEEDVNAAHDQLRRLKDVGVDLDTVTRDLQVDGVAAFAKSASDLGGALEAKCAKFRADRRGQSLDLRAYAGRLDARVAQWQRDETCQRIWSRDHTVWSKALVPELTDRLGWLTAPSEMRKQAAELSAFADDVLRFYPRIRRDEMRFCLFEAGPRILPELDPKLAAVADRVLRRRGADIRAGTPVRAIEARRVRLADETIEASTIVLAAGIVPNGIAADIPVVHDQRGRIAVDAAMRSRSHPQVWALGDCAAIPGPDGKPYPALAQHAVREARQLARNIKAAVDGRAPSPFVFRTLGTMASLGHSRAVARVFGFHLTGVLAWWLRRTYYLFQMPRWDRRLRIILDWTVALFFRPDITKEGLQVEREEARQALEVGRKRS